MEATLILVGTELLNGKMIDTNSIYMADELNKYGIKINLKMIVPDHLEKIISAIDYAKKTSNLVIISGGLGPTIDDITKEAVAKYLNKNLVVDEEELKELKEKFIKIGVEFIESNVKEVQKPFGSITFPNGVGMARAFYIDEIVCFPGVPNELYNMFPKFLKWYEKAKKLKIDKIYIKDLITYGIAESHLDNLIKDIFTEEGVEYEFLVKKFGIIIRLQTSFSKKNIVEKIVEKIYNIIGKNIFGEDEDRLENLILKKLKQEHKMISVAESCTGGLLADSFINISGASEVFLEGIITYSNESKIKRLGVKQETLKKYGAVSEEVAKEMVLGLKTDVGISTTGIAGPSGGSEDKPVGLVYIGIRVGKKIKIEKKLFKGTRQVIRKRIVLYSLFCLNNLLKGSKIQ